MARPKRYPDIIKCIDCGDQISDYRHKRCSKCFSKTRIVTPRYCLSCGEPSKDPRGYRGASGMCKRCQYKIYGKEKRLATYHEKLKKTAIKNCRQCGIESHKKTGYKNGYCHKCATSINNKKRTTGITIVCPVCSVEFWVQQNKIQKYQKGEMKYGLFCSKKCYGRYCKENIVGDRNPNWKGGAVGYYGPNWNQQRKLCRKRANYQCQNCGKTQEENKKALDVHHIKPIRTFNYIPDENDNYLLANDLSNLVALCKACHLLLEPR